MLKNFWFWIFIIIISIAIVVNKLQDSDKSYQLVIDSYRNKSFYGVIVNKYQDKQNHNYKTILISNSGGAKSVVIEWELGDLYNYLQINDSVIKEKGNLFVKVWREDLDTVLFMKFYSDDKPFFVDSSNYNSIK
ncbi:MAG: hypothetical protein AB7E36_07855 [Salinivirgaceae bacterium]